MLMMMNLMALSNATLVKTFNPFKTNPNKLTNSFPSSHVSFLNSLTPTTCKPLIATAATNDNMFEDRSADVELARLMALSPLDGRYWEKVKDLSPIMSEYGFIYYRVFVEIKWLLKLSEMDEIIEVPPFSEDTKSYLQGLIDNFSANDAINIKEFEKTTNHDVKAVEYFLKYKCQSNAELAKVLEFFHFSCTSEDINNLAHGLMLKEAMSSVMYPVMDEIIRTLCRMAKDYAHIPMLSRTHGQPASPTTLGKELSIFAERLSRRRKKLSQVKILGKFAGAVGNYSAHGSTYPDVNWPCVAEEFVKSLGFCFASYVTQIEAHDYMAEIFQSFSLFNTILIKFDRDVINYISKDYFKQTTKAGEIGSSTMPHKVNPIDFENSEGNLDYTNAGFSYLSAKLPISREQRDLTDSTVLRNMGVHFGHSLVAYKNILQGIGKLQVDEAQLNEDLNQNWEVLAEPIQMNMRRYGIPKPYEKLKELTRGKKIVKEKIRDFINGLDIPQDAKSRLLKLIPHNYVGAAVELARNVEHVVNKIMNGIWSDQLS